MVTRLFLRAVAISNDPPTSDSIPIERLFLNASELDEVWVDTHSASTPEVGKSARFSLVRDMGVGVRTVRGTVERKVKK